MNKLISLFALFFLISHVTADRAAFPIIGDVDDYNGEDQENVEYPIDENESSVGFEWSVPTLSLTPEDQPGIDAQLTPDGEVIVENTEFIAVLTESEEEGEVTQVVAAEANGFDGEEEEKASSDDGNDVNDSEIPFIAVENGEEGEITQVDEAEARPIDQEDEEDWSTLYNSDFVDDSEVSEIDLEKGEEGVPTEVVICGNEEEGIATEVTLYEGNPIDQKEEEDWSTLYNSDFVDDSEVSEIDLENGQEGVPTEVVLYEGNPIDQEDEEDRSTRSDSDDVDDTEVPIMALENGEEEVPAEVFIYENEEEGVPTEVVLYEGPPLDREEEEDGSTRSDGADINATEIPITTFKNGVFTPVILTQEQNDNKEDNVNEKDTPYPSVGIKEDGFLP